MYSLDDGTKVNHEKYADGLGGEETSDFDSHIDKRAVWKMAHRSKKNSETSKTGCQSGEICYN